MIQHTQQLRKHRETLQDNPNKEAKCLGTSFWCIYYFYLLIKLCLIKGLVRKRAQVAWGGISILFLYSNTSIFSACYLNITYIFITSRKNEFNISFFLESCTFSVEIFNFFIYIYVHVYLKVTSKKKGKDLLSPQICFLSVTLFNHSYMILITWICTT